jgi:hypothetical protein
MRIFDVYVNILKYMYSIRFNGGSSRSGSSSEVAQSTSNTDTPLVHTLDTSHPDKYRKRRKESHLKETKDSS